MEHGITNAATDVQGDVLATGKGTGVLIWEWDVIHGEICNSEVE